MATMGSNVARRAASQAAGESTTPTPTHRAELRSSCEPCHGAKLKCNREKPVCARCQKTGMSCAYAPTKRPGRPRKVVPAQNERQNKPEASQALHRTPSEVLLAPPDSLPSQDAAAFGTQWDFSSFVASNAELDRGLDDLFDVIATTKTAGGDALTVDANPFEGVGLPTPMSFEPEEGWLTFDAIGETVELPEPVVAIPSSAANIGPSSLSHRSVAWPTDLSQFSEDCAALSRSLAVLGNSASRIDGMETRCICPAAMTNLLSQRDNARETPPDAVLDACLHLQRILQWSWTIHKTCQRCRDDELAKLVAASIANEVVGMYRTIIDGHAKSCRGHGNDRPQYIPRPPGLGGAAAGSPLGSLLEWATLSFGSKEIQGSTKTAFLQRLIGLKLRQTGGLLGELVKGKSTDDAGQGVGQPLCMLVESTVERINVAAGMLSTID
ncbi:hypothetical protein QBC34DRAFT_410571 [Podospora aff. communis PSN243]|uniref:Zn(2)-C6 fungal-type domain-containing protein n=1 Tax=Podospora aff. communis PSN243 TaxID=3040156 RepID=A0AAV9GFI5_9PEZI|nr:hypothetical protein QBC34DRAFT_410571 [Podospora aff. communis PSN243]